MTKVKPLDRVKFSELLRQGMTEKEAFHELMKHADEVPAAPGAEEHQEPVFDEHHCPLCGGELVRYESCYRCKRCRWSKC